MKTKITVVLVVLFLASCSYDRNDDIKQSHSEISEKYIDENYYNWIKETGELIYKSNPVREDFGQYDKNSSRVASENKEKLTKKHLDEFGFTEESLFLLFKGYDRATLNPFTKKPDEIIINDYSTKNAKRMDSAKKYGGTAYLELGDPTIETFPLGTPEYRVSETWAYNRGSTEDELIKEFVYKTGTLTRWNLAMTAGVTTSFKVNIPFIGEAGAEVSLSTTAEGGGEETNEKETKTAYVAKVPPKSKRRVVMIEKIQQKRILYKVPIKITGWIWTAKHILYFSGGNTPAKKLMDGIKPEQRYYSWEITTKDNSDVEIYAEDPIPLN